jgi:hypothetical protein
LAIPLAILPVFNPFLEFRMGIRFTTNTWRAPLQLIDSWLPAPTMTKQAKTAPKVVQLFARAGWLGRSTTTAAAAAANDPINPQVPSAHRPSRVRVVRNTDAGASCRMDARLVISGRINDVCAELDRLAALENQARRQRA